MSIVVVGSLHGSPGATSLAVGLGACLASSVVVEADPAGGVLAARCGLQREPGLVTLAADRDAVGSERVHAHAQMTANALRVLPCSESAEHTTSLLRGAGGDVAARLDDAACTAVVDVGRLGIDGLLAPFLDLAVAVVVVSWPTVDALAVLAARLPGLRAYRPIVVLVGDRPYGPADVARDLALDAVSTIAFDVRGVDAMWTGRGQRGLPRSAYARSVRALADDLIAALVAASVEVEA